MYKKDNFLGCSNIVQLIQVESLTKCIRNWGNMHSTISKSLKRDLMSKLFQIFKEDTIKILSQKFHSIEKEKKNM